jgi:hypothetical protein
MKGISKRVVKSGTVGKVLVVPIHLVRLEFLNDRAFLHHFVLTSGLDNVRLSMYVPKRTSSTSSFIYPSVFGQCHGSVEVLHRNVEPTEGGFCSALRLPTIAFDRSMSLNVSHGSCAFWLLLINLEWGILSEPKMIFCLHLPPS